MGGFFGIASKKDCMLDVFFGVDYHSHLGTRRGGMAAWDEEIGLQRKIHNICNAPFRTKFEHIFEEMRGTSAIGCISDADPQPLLIRSNLGNYAICMTGVINNAEELIDQFLAFSGGHFDSMTGGKINQTELLSALINQKSDFTEGIHFAQKSMPADKQTGVISDEIIRLTKENSKQKYPEEFRMVVYEDFATGNVYRFITNHLGYDALTIAELYRERWNVELFFKWIKQHLHIKSFYGTSENAVYTQIWIAVSAFLLLAIAKKRMHIEEPSLYMISQTIGTMLFEKIPIPELFNKPINNNPKDDGQLDLFRDPKS